MPAFAKVMILAVIQGLTEFLPISSSGHLVLAGHFLGLETPGVALEVALHAGTLLSVLVYYRRRIIELAVEVFSGGPGRMYAAAVIIGTVPTVAAYALAHDRIEAAFERPAAVAAMLCVTGVVLLSVRFRGQGGRPLTAIKGLWIGVAQALAMIPGISRSGSTIAAARHGGLSPAKAAEFSLLLSVPALVGAIVLKGRDMFDGSLEGISPVTLAAGIAVSAAVGYGAIVWLLRSLAGGRFWLFGFYCLAAGALCAVLLAAGI